METWEREWEKEIEREREGERGTEEDQQRKASHGCEEDRFLPSYTAAHGDSSITSENGRGEIGHGLEQKMEEEEEQQGGSGTEERGGRGEGRGSVRRRRKKPYLTRVWRVLGRCFGREFFVAALWRPMWLTSVIAQVI